MALAIGLLLLVALLSSLFRLGIAADRRLGNPALRRLERELDIELDGDLDPGRLDLDRLTRDMAKACRDPSPPEPAAVEAAAEVREADLCRELLAGTIPAASYRQRMSELAHDAARSGGVR